MEEQTAVVGLDGLPEKQQGGASTEPSDSASIASSDSSDSNTESGSNAQDDGKAVEEVKEAEEESGDSLQLGDRVLIQSKRFGRTLGQLYYVDETLLRVLPDGVSDRLYDFPLEDGDIDPELGVTSIELEEGPRIGFVDLVGLRAGSRIDTFLADGSPVGIFTIQDVNTQSDSAVIEDETGAQETLDFSFRGIPRDAPFQVLRIAPEAAVEKTQQEEGKNTESEKEGEEGEELNEVEFLGTVEIPVIQYVAEIAAKDRVFSEASQKSDMLADLLAMLDRPTQKNTNVLKYLRSVVEIFQVLKNQAADRTLSPSSLADILENKNAPMVRPVLKTKRVLQLDMLAESTATEKQTEDLNIQLLDTTLDAMGRYIETFGGLQGNQEGLEGGLPTWYRYLGGLMDRFPMGDEYLGNSFTFDQDGEFLRSEVPDTSVPGLLKTGADKETAVSDDQVATVEFSLRRGLGPTIRGGASRIAFKATQADVKYYCLFPQTANFAVGAKRTGSLFTDILRSRPPYKSLSNLFKALGNPTDEPSATNILLLRSDSTTIANIELVEYFRVIAKTLTPRGLGDVTSLLMDLGILNKEFTPSQQEVLVERIKQVTLLLRGLIRQLRAPLPTVTPKAESFSGQPFFDSLKDLIAGQPILATAIETLRTRAPGYSGIDLGVLGLLLATAQDYTLSVLGQQAGPIQRERIRATRDLFRKTLLDAQQVRKNDQEKGAAPEINPCNHVKALTQIRRVQDDTERMSLLKKFIERFQGGREDNWLTCIVCSQNLICQHELIQVQQFKNPREYDALQKELVLQFAGGTFGAKHICRNCGIPIGDIDFDRNVEFDDEGRPLNGRGVIVDEDEEEEELIREQLSAPIGKAPELEFETPEKTLIYQTVRELCDKIGVFPDARSYKSIINRVNIELLRIPKREVYDAVQKKKPKGSVLIDYDVYVNRILVALVAACLLVDVQAKIPDYVVRYTIPGCKPGFDGFPLYPSADPKSASASIGIHYIACAINGISKQSGPFFLTGWQRERSDEKRQLLVVNAIVQTLQNIVITDPVIQAQLERKREYQKEVFGKQAGSGRPSEKIPLGFAPPIETDQESLSASAKSPVVPEAADGAALSKTAVAIGWIRAANRLASSSAHIEAGSPFAETGCCYTDLGKPGAFWQTNKDNLPPLPDSVPLAPALGRQTWLFVPYEARPLEPVEAEIPINLAFQIFARLCWRGPREGLPHELGYDGKCDWCDTAIPVEVLNPDVDKYGQPIIGERVLLDAFASQGIDISTETFERLLTAAHARTVFQSYRPPKPLDGGALMAKTAGLAPSPLESWREAVLSVQEKISRLPATATRVEIADTLSDLTNLTAVAEDTVRRRLGQETYDIVLSICNEPAHAILEIIRAYFSIPMQRIVSQYNTDALVVHRQYELSTDHVADLKQILAKHVAVVTGVSREDLGAFGVAKYEYYLKQISAVLAIANELRASRFPYGPILLPPVLRALLFGPLADLVDPNKYPAEATADASIAESGRAAMSIQKTIRGLVRKFKEEKLASSPELIREMIAKAQEKEQDGIINELDAMSEDDKRLELIKKKLGIGRWAIGGTKLIWAYNADQYDKEREARLQNYDAEGETRDGIDPQGRPVDAAGFTDYGADYTENQGGYDYKFYDEADAE